MQTKVPRDSDCGCGLHVSTHECHNFDGVSLKINNLDIPRKINIHLFCSLQWFSALTSLSSWWGKVYTQIDPMFLSGKDGNSFWRFKRKIFIYVFEEIPFEQHALLYISRENAHQKRPQEHKFFPYGKWYHTSWENWTRNLDATWLYFKNKV